jgi:hypothetical protein
MTETTRANPELSTGVQTPSPDDTPRLCACGCGQPCKSTYIRGHNLRKDSRRKPRAKTEPGNPFDDLPSGFEFDFTKPSWIADDPPRLNHDGNGTEIIIPSQLISGDHFHLVNPIEKSFTSSLVFVSAVLCHKDGSLMLGDDGRILWQIVKYSRKPEIIFEGQISVPATYLAYKISPGRTLIPPEWHRWVTVRAVNKAGVVRERDIAAMNLLQPQSKATWIDALDIYASGQITPVKHYIRTLWAKLKDDGLAIHGQGPVFHDNTRLFVAKSCVFDEKGTMRPDIRVDLSGLPESYAYYDVTPPEEITEEEIRAGMEELITAYGEAPDFPEVPAAFLGQMFTVPVAVIERKYFSAILLSGVKGSGKTYYVLRLDSVQSRTLRGDLRNIRPVLNLGDTTGTEKGPKYRVDGYAGFSITTDDVLKAGDSPARITQQSDKVSNLVRSFEAGGAALAGVDYTTNTVVSRESGTLQTSVKVCSELPITGPSTRDRMIVLTHLTAPWGKGGIFDKEISLRLSTPESREVQHRAWSAFAYWLFQRIDTDLEECWELAQDETRTWDVEQRMADRYAALIAGHHAFARFCASHGRDISETVIAAIAALRACALRQAQGSISVAVAFRKVIQDMLADGKLAFPGPPMVDPDGSESAAYGDPRIAVKFKDETGIEQTRLILPPVERLSELGLNLTTSSTPIPNPGAKVFGYTIPPRQDKGGHSGTALSHRWTIAVPTKMQRPLCHAASEYSKTRGGLSFDKDEIIRALGNEKLSENITAGGLAKRRIADSNDLETRKEIKQERILEIDCEWLFISESEE